MSKRLGGSESKVCQKLRQRAPCQFQHLRAPVITSNLSREGLAIAIQELEDCWRTYGEFSTQMALRCGGLAMPAPVIKSNLSEKINHAPEYLV